MFRRSALTRVSMTGAFMSTAEEKETKKGWKDLWFRPQTRDERVKDYIPEVLEESLAAQKAVLARENTARDQIVDHGQKILKDLENKAPVTNMFPAFVALLKLYKQENLVSQRAMHLLMYPGSTQVGAASQAAMPELVNSFAENLRNFIDTVEQDGSYVHDVKWAAGSKNKSKQLTAGKKEDAPQLEAGTTAKSAGDPEAAAAAAAAEAAIKDLEEPTAAAHEAEPKDVTLYVKCLAGMSMANQRLNDTRTALRCCDAALEHAMDPNRKGGVFAMKAGLLIQGKRFGDAVEAARLAIECAPQNPQGYLQGATALRLSGKTLEAAELLRLGTAQMPQNEQLAALLDKTEKILEKEPKQLGGGSTEAAAIPEGKAAPKQVTE